MPAALSAEVIIPRDGFITFQDGSGSFISVDEYEDGDVSIGELSNGNFDQKEFYSRGQIVSVRQTTKRVTELNLTILPRSLGDATIVNFLDLVRRTNFCASATSTRAGTDAHLLKCIYRVERSNFGAAADNIATAKYCDVTASPKEGEPMKLSVKVRIIEFKDDAASWTLT